MVHNGTGEGILGIGVDVHLDKKLLAFRTSQEPFFIDVRQSIDVMSAVVELEDDKPFYIQPGEFIRENTPVVSIVQMNPLKMRTAIQERYASLMRPGLPVEFGVESFKGQKLEARWLCQPSRGSGHAHVFG
jgi:deoxycytidine triphosphate deaminase